MNHEPVLLAELLDYMALGGESAGPEFLLDCTLGGAGHASAMLKANASLFLVGVDRDSFALDFARESLADSFGAFEVEGGEDLEHFCGWRFNRGVLSFGAFSEVANLLVELPDDWPFSLLPPERGFARIIVDLGVSSYQLDEPSRGFSFRFDSRLDMRMTPSARLCAHDVVNNFIPSELARVFYRGGVGPRSAHLAREIARKRPIDTTGELAELCCGFFRPRKRSAGGVRRRHPATLPFQAIRMAVNDELAEIETFMSVVPKLLAPGGRLAVICFHSLEDRVVARAMRRWHSREESFGTLLTKKALLPSATESSSNPRSRSARLRIFEAHA